QGIGHLTDRRDRSLEVRRRLTSGAADARDDLDGVEQQLGMDERVLAPLRLVHGGEPRVGDLAQVAGVRVDGPELPLDPEGGAVRRGEGQRAHSASTTMMCWAPAIRVRTSVAASSPRSASWERSASGVTAVPRFLMVTRPTPRSRRYARRRLTLNGIESSTR